MPIISVRIPQLGEGLQEALLVEFLKKPGDLVKRDEPIYVMETDKATTDVESPYSGTLVQWTVETGSVLEIGAEIGKMEVAEGVKEMPVGHGPPDTGTATSSSSQGSSVAVAAVPRKRATRSSVQIPPRDAQVPEGTWVVGRRGPDPMFRVEIDARRCRRLSRRRTGNGSRRTLTMSSHFQNRKSRSTIDWLAEPRCASP